MKVKVEILTVESTSEAERTAMAGLAHEIKKTHSDVNWSESAPSDRSPAYTPDFTIRWTQETNTELDATRGAESLVKELATAHSLTLPRVRFRVGPPT